MNVSFTQKQEKYIAAQLSSGDYQNASEVVRDALRLHALYREKVIEDLRQEIAKGWEDAASTRSVSDIVQSKQKSRPNG